MATTSVSFSVAQANQMLPLVSPIVQDIVNSFQELNRLEAAYLRRVEARVQSHFKLETPALRRAREERNAARRKLDDYIKELTSLHVKLDDRRHGAIVFPAEDRHGRQVRLCWRLGEPSIRFWRLESSDLHHPIDLYEE